MSKHTPGPWYVYEHEDERRIGVPLMAGRYVPHAVVRHPGDIPNGTLDANARLIAAAPDLLRAIGDVRTRLIEHGHGQIPAYAFSEIMEAIDAAIAKAEGVDA